MKKIYLLVFVLFSSIVLFSQETKIVTKKSIFESLAEPDLKTGAKVILNQDNRIDSVFALRKLQSSSATMIGYRVQVFSSNEQITAKNEAYEIEKKMVEAFPDYPVYVSYIAPFWKVRIGDFRTTQEAQILRSEISELSPSLRNYTYTVRDQVNY
jgi:hypothetical protein